MDVTINVPRKIFYLRLQGYADASVSENEIVTYATFVYKYFKKDSMV